MYSQHSERHFSNRNNWLRASVLGANDGLISTASLLTGVAAAAPDFQTLLLTGVSALIGGAVSMAAGEYVSVSSQSDTEKADLRKERCELEANPAAELAELTEIYRRRGLSDALAAEVAQALMEQDALSAHARDEIGITETSAAKPMQAALASAGSFCAGAILPLLVALTAPPPLFLRWRQPLYADSPRWVTPPPNSAAHLSYPPSCACACGAWRRWPLPALSANWQA